MNYYYGENGRMYDFVDPNRTNGPDTHPYSFDAHYIWRSGDVEGANVIWADRMFQHDWDLAQKAFGPKKGSSSGNLTKTECEEILKDYYGKPVKCVAFALSCNVSNGYPIGMFFVKD